MPANAPTGIRQIPDKGYKILIFGSIRSVFSLLREIAFRIITNPFTPIQRIGISIFTLLSTPNQSLRIKTKMHSTIPIKVQTIWIDSSFLLMRFIFFFHKIRIRGMRMFSGGRQINSNVMRFTILFHLIVA